MRREGRFLTGLLLALALAVPSLGAQTRKASSAEGPSPRDDKGEALLGVASFYMSEEEAVYPFLGDNLARLLGEMMGEIPLHFVNDEERDALAAAARARSRQTVLKDLDELQARRDGLLFTGPDYRRDGAGRASLDRSIAEARNKLSFLDHLNIKDVWVNRERELKLFTSREDGEMLLPPVISPAGTAKKAGVDYLLYGRVEIQGENHFTATAFFYGLASDLCLARAQAAGSWQETARVAEELFQGLAEAVVGRPWAVLSVDVEPEEAEIYWEDRLIGIGKARLPYVSPGQYLIRGSAKGYETREESIVLPPLAVKELTMSLPPMDLGELRVSSLPSGAEVYLGAQRLGSTPLEIPLSQSSQILRLEAEGYKSRALVFPPPAGQYEQVLPRDIFSWKERIESSRRHFYRAFGWFVMSIPVPLLLNGLYQNSAFAHIQYSAGPSANPETLRGMAERADFLYYSYFGSLFISGSLLVNAVQKLFDYIRIGEEAQRYPERWRRD